MKKRIILFGIIITIILLFAYISFRSDGIEDEYIKTLRPQTDRIAVSLHLFEKSKSLADRNLPGFIDITRKKYPNLTLIAVSDKSDRILVSGKNDSLITNKENAEIMDAFSGNKESLSSKNGFKIRYINDIKHYVFVKPLAVGKLLLVFSYKLRGKLLIKLILELLLVVIVAIIITSAFYLYLVRTGYALREKPAPVPAEPVEIPRQVRTAASEPEAPAIRADNQLREKTMELFSYISSSYKTDTISLYLLRTDTGNLEKIYDSKGETFIEIDSPGFEVLDISEEIRDELENASTMLLETGKRLIIPILHDSSLLAVLNCFREPAFKGHELTDIARHAEGLGEAAGVYISFDDMMTDRGTGLFTKSFLNIKYRELLRDFNENGIGFGILAVSPFDPGKSADPYSINSALKYLVQQIRPYLPSEVTLARHDDCLVVLIQGFLYSELNDLKGMVMRSLSRTRVKTESGRRITVEPSCKIAATDSITDGSDILSTVLTAIS